MFGYVTPLTEELRVRENIFYQSVYCGLCRCMGKRVCSGSRLTLSYDTVFLFLIRHAFSEETLTFIEKRCAASPFRKKKMLERGPTLDYCAVAGALLAFYSLADNAADRRGIKKLAARLLLLPARRMRKKANLPALDSFLKETLASLSEKEKQGASPDALAETFGTLLSGIFSFGLEGDGERITRELGFHVGKWIYLLDAADDFEKDRKNGEFNPFDRVEKELLRCALNLELEAASAALALVPFREAGVKDLAENILFLGMPSRTEKVLARYPDPPAPSDPATPSAPAASHSSSDT